MCWNIFYVWQGTDMSMKWVGRLYHNLQQHDTSQSPRQSPTPLWLWDLPYIWLGLHLMATSHNRRCWNTSLCKTKTWCEYEVGGKTKSYLQHDTVIVQENLLLFFDCEVFSDTKMRCMAFKLYLLYNRFHLIYLSISFVLKQAGWILS